MRSHIKTIFPKTADRRKRAVSADLWLLTDPMIPIHMAHIREPIARIRQEGTIIVGRCGIMPVAVKTHTRISQVP